jgi:ABC-type multidrug transport system ATPase subunit
MKHTLEIDGVQLDFGERTILRSIYIKSETGKVTGILGRNGCGKSCLLKIIFGELKAQDKSVRINGKSLFEDSRNSEDMKMLPQFNFLPKHIKISQAFKHFDLDLDFAEFCDLFDEFKKIGDLKIKELSGGSIRILETFLILKSNTKFCILDEPFSHLSPKNASAFIQIIEQEKANKGIILTDHLYRHITDISDYLYVITNSASYKIESIDQLKNYGYLN